ncbi:MAG TPA: DNA polymerase III subunit gamma/tau [Desulfonatronum sp.]|mgnify:CR=1 FL=1|nr:DNA polymerase III subunit gamma/tau [Desulfonatronum sp.]
MSTTHTQLTAKYRPQTFAQVVGQEDIRAVLSRAAATDRIAAAYLFSGTRGVGKTTLARIFAKAINCRTAPTPEPCNQCLHCRQITIGSAVDVAEIDGASNRGIEQARRLKEDVGYAPLECRFKIIIIDEAHMLTKEAFNALLKTLEEPPPGVTFIMATTEPQKFPATIISRCQHYVFKRLTQSQLETHLRHILEQEGRPFEPAATTLLARRAAGSVRDGMSLLEQVLTIGEKTLRLEDVRRILGLAGGELFQRLVEAIRDQDCIAVSEVLRTLLDHGLDLGFFLRELAALWRNMFLLRQAGQKALPLLELSGDEAKIWLNVANELSPTYIHAAWQLTLEGQRQVLASLEPAQALEMLLLNLAYLPRLLRLEDIAEEAFNGFPQAPAAKSQNARKQSRPSQESQVKPPQPVPDAELAAHEPVPCADSAPRHETLPVRNPVSGSAIRTPSGSTLSDGYPPPTMSRPKAAAREPKISIETPTWKGFLDHYDTQCKKEKACLPGLRQVEGELSENELVLRCQTLFQYQGLRSPQKWRILEQLAKEYFGAGISVTLRGPEEIESTKGGKGNDEYCKHPLVQEIIKQFQATVISMEPRDHHT